MKKTKKLPISRETIRQLSSLDIVRGAVDTSPYTIPVQVCANTSLGPNCSVAICVDTHGSGCTGQATFTC